ncbi:MAG: molybdenum cofactor biosynthesis protein MoeA, partial [Leptospira sp.]|nr:molybdenum cofactor biosynthesis protein MoeA [Leptospira sp.]
GENHGEIVPLLQFAGDRKIPIRFLELMKMGHLHGSNNDKLYTEIEILSDIDSNFGPIRKLDRKKSSTANYWETGNGFVFGIIANESSPFCSDCNRLRIDHRGNLYGCLSSPKGYPLLSVLKTGMDITPVLYQALQQKQKVRFTGSDLSMKAIGG